MRASCVRSLLVLSWVALENSGPLAAASAVTNAAAGITLSHPTPPPTPAPTPPPRLVLSGQGCDGGTSTEDGTCTDVLIRADGVIHVDLGATCVLEGYPYEPCPASKTLEECNDVDYNSEVVISGDVVNPSIVATYQLKYECWPEDLRDDYSMVTAKRVVQVLATAPGSGCASGGFALQGHLNIYLCDWGGNGLIYEQDLQCSSDYHVCTGADIYANKVTWANAHAQSGCYAYNAATDCGACFATCKAAGDSVPDSLNGNTGCHNALRPDMAGLGAGCDSGIGGSEDPDSGGCLAGGGSISAHDDSVMCYTHRRDVGVACCPNI